MPDEEQNKDTIDEQNDGCQQEDSQGNKTSMQENKKGDKAPMQEDDDEHGEVMVTIPVTMPLSQFN